MTTERNAHARAFLNTPPAAGRAWGALSYAYDYEVENAMYLGWFDDNPKKTHGEGVGRSALIISRHGKRQGEHDRM